MAMSDKENKRNGSVRQAEQASGGAVMEVEGSTTGKRGQKAIAWMSRVGQRNWIIIGALVLIGVAVWLNWTFFSDAASTGYAGYGDSSGMTDGSQDADNSAGTGESDYFAVAQVNRKRARDESMAVLQNVIDSADASEETKNEALAEMNTMADEIEKEANIEALLCSGGFADCLAVMNGNQIQVIVKSEGELQTAQIAKINTVVYEQTGIEPQGVTIVHKN